MSKRLDFGAVWINTHIPIVAEMPHGGFKKSGYGKDLSMYGFEDYTRIKHVMAISSPDPWAAPDALSWLGCPDERDHELFSRRLDL
jgi:hypothetical protein